MDAALLFRGSGLIDLALENGDLETGSDLESAVIISLFSNRRANNDDELPHDFESRQGWWGDNFPNTDSDKIGSRLWLLSREKQTLDTLNRAREYVKESLKWLVDDGVASRVDSVVEYISQGVMGISVIIYKPEGESRFKFEHVWRQFD